MEKYDKLIKALRYCAESGDFNCNKDCPMYPNYPKCLTKMDMDAASAIEAMQAEVDTLKRTDIKRCQECLYLGQPVGEEFVPKHGEWELIDGAEPMRWGCSRCKYMSWETSNYCPRCGAKMEVQDGKRCD